MNKHDEEECESYTNLPSWVKNLPGTANTPYIVIGVDYGAFPSQPIDLGFFDIESNAFKATVEVSNEGATCSSCQEDYPYAVGASNFVCAGCKLWEACK